GLPAGAVEREHELPAEAFSQRVFRHERLQLSDEIGVTSEGQVGFEALLEHRELQLLEASDLSLRKRLVCDVREGRPPPEGGRRPEEFGSLRRTTLRERLARLRQQPLAPRRVQFLRCEDKRVTGRPADQTRCSKRRAQARDVRPHRYLGRRRWLAVPQVFDQPIARDDFAGVEHEEREKRTLLTATERGRTTVLDDLERPEDAEFHVSMVRGLQASCNECARRLRNPRHESTEGGT